MSGQRKNLRCSINNDPKLFSRDLFRDMPRKDIVILNPNAPDLQGRYDLRKRYSLSDEVVDIDEKTMEGLIDIMPSLYVHRFITEIDGHGPTLTMQLMKSRGKTELTDMGWDFNPVPFVDDPKPTNNS